MVFFHSLCEWDGMHVQIAQDSDLVGYNLKTRGEIWQFDKASCHSWCLYKKHNLNHRLLGVSLARWSRDQRSPWRVRSHMTWEILNDSFDSWGIHSFFLKEDFWSTRMGIDQPLAVGKKGISSCQNRSHKDPIFVSKKVSNYEVLHINMVFGGVFRSLFLHGVFSQLCRSGWAKGGHCGARIFPVAPRWVKIGWNNCQIVRCYDAVRIAGVGKLFVRSDEESLLRRFHQTIEIYCFPCLNGAELWISKMKSHWSLWWLWLFSKQRKLEKRCIMKNLCLTYLIACACAHVVLGCLI